MLKYHMPGNPLDYKMWFLTLMKFCVFGLWKMDQATCGER